ncbi:hypothetical protein SDC9_153520 [bioreactor metagenome]|uniref:Uncharacterized protein n=1 Tax=bioreactor metagenome TaxID=1076179 RepID=A0A645F0V8_9ZZZZ
MSRRLYCGHASAASQQESNGVPCVEASEIGEGKRGGGSFNLVALTGYRNRSRCGGGGRSRLISPRHLGGIRPHGAHGSRPIKHIPCLNSGNRRKGSAPVDGGAAERKGDLRLPVGFRYHGSLHCVVHQCDKVDLARGGERIAECCNIYGSRFVFRGKQVIQ